MKNDIFIDLVSIDVTGNVLDISVKGNSIVSELISKNSEEDFERDFVIWNNTETMLQAEFYDRAFALYSLNLVKGKRKLDRALKEIGRVLKRDARLFIWDLDIPRMTLRENYRVRISLPMGRKGKIYIKTGFNPFRIKRVDLIKALEKNGFKILSEKIDGLNFYLEAAKE